MSAHSLCMTYMRTRTWLSARHPARSPQTMGMHEFMAPVVCRAGMWDLLYTAARYVHRPEALALLALAAVVVGVPLRRCVLNTPCSGPSKHVDGMS